MSDISNRTPAHRAGIIAVSVAMVAVAAALVAVVVTGSQVETPLALSAALLGLAAGRHALVRGRA